MCLKLKKFYEKKCCNKNILVSSKAFILKTSSITTVELNPDCPCYFAGQEWKSFFEERKKDWSESRRLKLNKVKKLTFQILYHIHFI